MSSAATEEAQAQQQNASSASSSSKEHEANVPQQQQNLKKEDFLLLHELGEGSYSTVYLASEYETSRKFAMKVCFKKKIIREKKVQQIFRERDILRLLSTPEHSSPFILRLYCTFQDAECLYFVLTLADKKDLLSRLKSLGGKLSVEQAKFVMAQLWTALDHIHTLNVVHRDVKPENILLSQNGNILLSDFGCAKRLDLASNEKTADEEKVECVDGVEQGQKPSNRRRCSFVGTAQYVSPEVLNGQEITTACDWWAFGVILFELLAGHRPFSGESEYLLYQQILRLEYKFPEEFPSVETQQLIQRILRISPSERIGSKEQGGAKQIQKHSFFNGINWNGLEHQKSPIFPEYDQKIAN